MLNQSRATTIALAATCALVLSSCGGGGAEDTAAPPAPTGTAPAAAAPAATAPASSIVLTPVPKQAVVIDGVGYTAYQNPGETFRIICQEPCPVAENYIYAKYAGFKPMKD